MKTRSALAALTLAPWCALALAQTAPSPAPSPADFTVGDIRVEGLQRVSEGTVYNYLPVNIGDHLTPQRAREAIRALRSEEHTSELQSQSNLVCRLLLEKQRSQLERLGHGDGCRDRPGQGAPHIARI